MHFLILKKLSLFEQEHSFWDKGILSLDLYKRLHHIAWSSFLLGFLTAQTTLRSSRNMKLTTLSGWWQNISLRRIYMEVSSNWCNFEFYNRGYFICLLKNKIKNKKIFCALHSLGQFGFSFSYLIEWKFGNWFYLLRKDFVGGQFSYQLI